MNRLALSLFLTLLCCWAVGVQAQTSRSRFGDTLTLADETYLIRLCLYRAIIDRDMPDFQSIDSNKIILSNQNIDEDAVPHIPSWQIILLDSAQIQQRTDSLGGFYYLNFGPFKFVDNNITIWLGNSRTQRSKDRRPVMSGGHFGMEFTKGKDQWIIQYLPKVIY